MLTKEQLDALEMKIYTAAMDGDIRSGLALLKLRSDAGEPPTSGGVVILPATAIDFNLTDYTPAPAKAEYTSGIDYETDTDKV